MQLSYCVFTYELQICATITAVLKDSGQYCIHLLDGGPQKLET